MCILLEFMYYNPIITMHGPMNIKNSNRVSYIIKSIMVVTNVSPPVNQWWIHISDKTPTSL